MILPFTFILFCAICAGLYLHSWLAGLAIYVGLCAIVGTVVTIARNTRR